MRKSIDLHGLSHEESLVKVEEYLLLNSFNNDLDLELITGKSPKLQEKIINQKVDINVLKARAKAIQDKENIKNMIILIFFVIALGVTGLYFSI